MLAQVALLDFPLTCVMDYAVVFTLCVALNLITNTIVMGTIYNYLKDISLLSGLYNHLHL